MNMSISRTRLAYRICKVQTAASAVGCGWSEKLNNRKSDGGMTGDVCYRICTIDRSKDVIMSPERRHIFKNGLSPLAPVEVPIECCHLQKP